MARRKSKPTRKAVSTKAFVARMLDAKASKVLQNPGAQKKKNAVPIMAEVRRSRKGPNPYEALKNSPSSPPKFFHRDGAHRYTQRPLGFK